MGRTRGADPGRRWVSHGLFVLGRTGALCTPLGAGHAALAPHPRRRHARRVVIVILWSEHAGRRERSCAEAKASADDGPGDGENGAGDRWARRGQHIRAVQLDLLILGALAYTYVLPYTDLDSLIGEGA